MRYGIGRRTWRLSALRQLPKPVVLLFALLIGGLSLQTVPANAVGTVVAGFEIDGNIATNGNHDWQDIGVTPFDDMVGGSDVTTFTSSSKENDVSSWSLGANGAPPPKVDIGYHAGYIARDGGTGHWWLFAAWDRVSDKGTGSMIFELNQSGTGPTDRKKGDVRVVADVSTSDGMTFNNAKMWDGSDWNDSVDGSAVLFQHSSSSIDALGPWASSPNVDSGKIGENRFAEIGLDLTALKLTDSSDACHVTGPGAWQLRSTTGKDQEDDKPDSDGPKNLSDGTAVHQLTMPATCGSLVWQKRADSVEGNLIGGATFTLEMPDNAAPSLVPAGVSLPMTIVDNGPNDADSRLGYFEVDNLSPCDYKLSEIAAPAGYFGGSSPRMVSIMAGVQTDAGVFINTLGTVEFTKATKGDASALVAGAEFTLTALSGAAADEPWNLDDHPVVVQDNGSHDSDPAGGKFSVTGLPMGWYSVHETGRPVGYDLDPVLGYAHVMSESMTDVYLSQDPAETDMPYVFANTMRLSSIEINKTDSNTKLPLNGSIFWICRDDSSTEGFVPAVDCSTDNRVEIITTGDNGDGAAKSAGLPFGNYWVWEDAAPIGYQLDDPRYQGVNITPENDGASIALSFADAEKLVDTRLRKVDADTGAGLAGATFELYRETATEPVLIGTCQTLADDATTTEVNEAGLCDPMFKGLAFGTYRIVETVTPAGYQTPTADFQFTLGPIEGEAGSVDVSVDNTAVVRVPVPGLVKSSNPVSGSTVTASDTITYTLTLTNTGDTPAVGTIVDALPAGVSVLDVGGGVVSGGGNTITWTGISVAPGETQTLSYTVVVDATAPAGTITNTATWTVGTITVTGSTTHTIAAGGGGGGGGGGLPFTGSNVSANMGAAAVALTAGLALMRRRRRTSGE